MSVNDDLSDLDSNIDKTFISQSGKYNKNIIYNTSCARFLRRSASRRHDHDVPSIGNLFNCTLYNLFLKLLFLAGTKLKIKLNL